MLIVSDNYPGVQRKGVLPESCQLFNNILCNTTILSSIAAVLVYVHPGTGDTLNILDVTTSTNCDS